MRKYILALCLGLLLHASLQAQHRLRLLIKGNSDSLPLAGATVTIALLNRTALADSTGLAVFDNLAKGSYRVAISHTGRHEQQVTINVPQLTDAPFDVVLEEEEEAEEEVIVNATRTSRTIANTPTRVEVISGEELDEKGNMKPGDIRMLLNESTGIQTQQTSATSYNSSIRIQGLDGRYTQILRDGYPLYAGFSGGLSIMQIAPLDLRQVEVIKGSSSTLYGGGAIAGLVNLVSKTPTDEREISLMANGTSAGGLDLSSFYSQRYGTIGVTLFGSANYGSAYDPAKTGLTAIPKFDRYTIAPRLFVYGKRTTANAGFSYITEDRIGGNINYIKRGGSGFFEQNNSDRFTTQVAVAHQLGGGTLNFKNSYTRFDRAIAIPNYTFKALQQSSFSELTYAFETSRSAWVIGANFLTDNLDEVAPTATPVRDYHYDTYGAFVQSTWSPTDRFTLETGLRGDYVYEYGFELLPRVSALLKATPQLTFRLGGGAGYKTPTLFNEEAERVQFQNIRPIAGGTGNERSLGGNFDVNYRRSFGELGFSINQLFFYTRLEKPLVLQPAGGVASEFKNADGHIDTKGLETNIRFTYGDFKLFIGYTYADVNTHFNSARQRLPLTAKHRLNNVLMYEVEEKWKIGLEAYYTSKQSLSDGSSGKPYWVTGFMAEKLWEKFSLFINFENFTDTRQTRFDTIYTGSVDAPQFRDIYAPVDGFVVNGGFKVRL
jgi:iron complex outermembrane receptor protein